MEADNNHKTPLEDQSSFSNPQNKSKLTLDPDILIHKDNLLRAKSIDEASDIIVERMMKFVREDLNENKS